MLLLWLEFTIAASKRGRRFTEEVKMVLGKPGTLGQRYDRSERKRRNYRSTEGGIRKEEQTGDSKKLKAFCFFDKCVMIEN